MNFTKIMHSKIFVIALVLLLGLSSGRAITVAGYNFQDNAFADTVVSSFGSYTNAGAATLEAAVTGPSLTKYAFSFTSGAFIILGFTDNLLVNGAGKDLALFEYGIPSTFSITIGTITSNYLSTATGFTSMIGRDTFQVNVALIDLTDFNIAPNATLNSIKIGMDDTLNGVPTLGVAGALNSQAIPEAGSTISFLATGLIGLGFLRKKLK